MPENTKAATRPYIAKRYLRESEWEVVVPGMSGMLGGDGHIFYDRNGRLSMTGIGFTMTEEQAHAMMEGISLAMKTKNEERNNG